MSETGARPIAPSSKLALYVAGLVSAYVISDPLTVLGLAAVIIVIALIVIGQSPRAVPRTRWRMAVVFVTWVFLMRLALDVVAGVPWNDHSAWLVAGRQSARVAVLAVGVIALLAITTARDIIDELEHSRLPRSARLLVMMLVQYPRVLRARYEQIVEAQVARGAERPRSVIQRAAHGAALLLPVMQSELNAVGERAGLIHLRGLDLEVPTIDSAGRSASDLVALAGSIAMVAGAVILRLAR
jgi:hypothetical protein